MAASLSLVVAASLAILAGLAGASQDVKANKFIVTYSILPDPFHYFSFYNMPRTIEEAVKSDFSLAETQEVTTLYCRKNDYRVCVLFDKKGSVAGIQVSVATSEVEQANLPKELYHQDHHWFKQTLLGVDVYSIIAYFVHPDVLNNGGRFMDEDTPTAQHGLFLPLFDDPHAERVDVLLGENMAEMAGFTKQACFKGMGHHYFQGLDKTSKCEKNKPFFLLFSPQSHELHGFGISQFGKVSQGRGFLSGWFETPPAAVAKMIAPNSPPCLTEFVNKYGIFTLHVYFVDQPWKISC